MKEHSLPAPISSPTISGPALLLCILGMLGALALSSADTFLLWWYGFQAPFSVWHLLLVVPYGLNIAAFFLPVAVRKLLGAGQINPNEQAWVVFGILTGYAVISMLLLIAIFEGFCPGCYFG